MFNGERDLVFKVEKIADYTFRIPLESKLGMRVPGIVFADKALLEKARQDGALKQVVNVASLPGITGASLAMPDIHWGYGFPIGGVAATIPGEGGVISPGGVGFDISCGVRLIRTELEARDCQASLEQVMHELARNVPKGVGSRGKVKTRGREMEKLMLEGAAWAVKRGYGWPEDLERIEERGALGGADPAKVSKRALERGLDQTGTLGAGNHFLELQEVVEVYEPTAANVFGLFKGQLVVMVHSGSRGFGHQICTDYLKVMDRAVKKYGFNLPDRQLACAPVNSPEGEGYYAAMACAVNYALANRQVLGHWVRESFEKAFRKSARSLGMELVYDVSHNIAKFEEHLVNGRKTRVCIHRKGATRAFGPHHPSLPEKYRSIGQPVIIPGDMGRASYVLVGTEKGQQLAFASTCHGAGRVMSRKQAKKRVRGEVLKRELEEKGIVVIAGHMGLLAEEAPQAYKDVSEVVDICEGVGLSKKVAKLRPLGVLKG
jgi:tRNA-splicing ligase RtcB